MFTSDVSGFLKVKQITSRHCPEPPPVSTAGSCRDSWHTQKPPPLPSHYAHVRLCCGSASFITVHTWVKHYFDSSWVSKLFSWASFSLCDGQGNNPSMITVRDLRGSGV